MAARSIWGSLADPTAPATYDVALTSSQTLAQLYNGSFGNGSGFKPSVSGQVVLTLPVAASSGGSPLGTIALTIPNLGSFTHDLLTGAGTSGDATFSAPNVQSAVASTDLLSNLNEIVNDIDSYLNQIKSLLDSGLFSLDIPLVGKALMSAGSTADSFITSIETQISNLSTVVESSATSYILQLQTLLFDALGPTGLNLLQDPPAPSANNEVIIQYETIGASSFTTYDGTPSSLPTDPSQIQDVRFELNLGHTYSLNVPLSGDLGVPGLGLSVNQGSSIVVSLVYAYTLDFGVDRSGGFYVYTPGTGNDLSVALSAGLSAGAALTAQLGFLALTAKPDPSEPTQISLAFSVGLNNGTTINPDPQTLTVGQLAGVLSNITPHITGSAEVALDLDLGFDLNGGQVDATYPSFTAKLLIGDTGDNQMPWTFDGSNLDSTTPPGVSLTDITFQFGSFIDHYIGEIIGPIANALKPIEPELNFLETTVPILNESLIDAVVGLLGGSSSDVGELFKFVTTIIDFGSYFSSRAAATVSASTWAI